MIRRPPRSPLFPHPTLSRPLGGTGAAGAVGGPPRRCAGGGSRPRAGGEHHPGDHRSEEHTSELQSQSNIVCRLLLAKKKDSISAAAVKPRVEGVPIVDGAMM